MESSRRVIYLGLRDPYLKLHALSRVVRLSTLRGCDPHFGTFILIVWQDMNHKQKWKLINSKTETDLQKQTET